MKSILQEKSMNFSILTVELTRQLQSKKEFIISKQLLRSGTSIGANIVEAKNGFSKKDFVFKLNISQKECAETLYWLELLYKTESISKSKFNMMSNLGSELLKMIRSSIITTTKNHNI